MHHVHHDSLLKRKKHIQSVYPARPWPTFCLSLQSVCREPLHRDAGPILGHACVAVKMLALQGGIYNVCGMYNV